MINYETQYLREMEIEQALRCYYRLASLLNETIPVTLKEEIKYMLSVCDTKLTEKKYFEDEVSF